MCRATSLAASRRASSRSAVSGPCTAAQIEPSTSSPARTATATRGSVKSSVSRGSGSTYTVWSLRYRSRNTPRSPSMREYRSGTCRPRMVSTRDGSASSCRPEKASTRELRSSIVIGASSSAAIALANANRSPAGSPPSDSGSATPTSPSASSDRSTAASCVQDAPRVKPSSATPDSAAAAFSSGSSGTGARTTSPAACCVPSAASRAATSAAASQPDAEDERVPRQDRLVQRVVDRDAADLVGVLEIAVHQFEQGGAQVVQHATEVGARGREVTRRTTTRVRGARLPALRCGNHSVDVVTSASRSGNGSTPRPGPVGTGRCPSSRTNGSVMSVCVVAVGRRRVAGQREAGQRGEGDVGGAAEAGLEHAAAPHGDAVRRRRRRGCGAPRGSRRPGRA